MMDDGMGWMVWMDFTACDDKRGAYELAHGSRKGLQDWRVWAL
jgi:hypothetical protein